MAGVRHAVTLVVWGAVAAMEPFFNLSGRNVSMLGFGCASQESRPYTEALELGYRHFDSAFVCQNHKGLGQAIRNSSVPREEVFVTTKVSSMLEHRYCCFGLLQLPHPVFDPDPYHPMAGGGLNVKGRELLGLRLALEELGFEYIDLCLIHRPVVTNLEMQMLYLPHYEMVDFLDDIERLLFRELMKAALRLESMGSGAEHAAALRVESWRQMEEAKELGICKHIGVSNYPLGALQEMETYARQMPEVLQIEHTPRFTNPEIRAWAQQRNIPVTGYGTGVTKFVAAAQLASIARHLGRTPNQVVLRWRLQSGVGLLQGTSRFDRMVENRGVLDFELSPQEMAMMDSMNEDYPTYFDLTYFEAKDASLVYSILVLSVTLLACSSPLACCCWCCCRLCCGRRKSAEKDD